MRISQVRTFGALERPPERPAGNQIPPEVAAELRQLSSAVKTQGTRLRYYDEMNRRWFAQEAALARAPVKKKSEPAGKRVMKALFGTLANDQNPQ